VDWTAEEIENYKRASAFTVFHKKLSVLAQPYLDGQWTLADIGCGPGLLAVHIAPMVGRVTAIDRDPLAIGALEASLDELFYTDRAAADKIEPVLKDIRDLAEEARWDAVLLSFFGASARQLDALLPRARRRALIFTHGRAGETGFGEDTAEKTGRGEKDQGEQGDQGEQEEQEPKLSCEALEDYLGKKGYAYKKSVMEMQFGQPFKTIEEIHRFLEDSVGGCGNDVCTGLGAERAKDDAVRRMADVEERIIRTNRFDFPYYLPKSMSVALFIIAMGATTEPNRSLP
jgi:predicted RNA methylase